MHYETNYAGLSDAEKQAKALQDVKDYLGEPAFDNITREARKTPMSLQAFAMAASLAGIEGYPVEIWHNHIYQ